MFVTVQILNDAPAVLYLGKICKQLGYSSKWKEGQSQTYLRTATLFFANRAISCQLSHPGVTKDEVNSVSADSSAETSRSSAWGDQVR